MLIHPTKKARPIFSAIKETNYPDAGKAFSLANPFFSWHANYYNENRKKILVLINDLTLMPVVLADINAKNKRELSDYIMEGIAQSFEIAGIPDELIEQYLDLMGEVELGAGFNRSVTGVTTMYTNMLPDFHVNFLTVVQRHLMAFLMSSPVSSIEEHFPENALKNRIRESLVIHPVTLEAATDKLNQTWQKTTDWQAFSKWDDYVGRIDLGDDFLRIFNEMEDNNYLILEDLTAYFMTFKKLSSKTSRRHVANISFYLNDFLLYQQLLTPIVGIEEIPSFLGGYYLDKELDPSRAGLKQVASSVKKFYEYLAEIEAIDKKALQVVKEEIKVGIELGESQLYFY